MIVKNEKFTKFHGVDRELIQWNPVIDKEKCIGCGTCTTSCSRGVYKFDFKENKSVVANPTHCMVACITCANLCPAGAIKFVDEKDTPRKKAQRIVKEFNLVNKSKEELGKRKEELNFNE